MTVIATQHVTNPDGSIDRINTLQCDGGGCETTIKSDNPEWLNWALLLGFAGPNYEDTVFEDNLNFCTPGCLLFWAERAVGVKV